MEEKDLENVNEIDMEIDASLLDDDDTFGSMPIKNSKPNTFDGEEIDFDDRPIKSVTGIKINLADDDNVADYRFNRPKMEDEIPTVNSASINCNSEQDIMNALNDVNTPRGMMNNNFTGINEIDMECSIGEDDEDFIPGKSFIRKDEFIENSPELVSEEMIQEKKKKEKVSQGKVEADYWDRLAKKHKDSNVKGAHNIHAHYGGDPKLAMDMFNHDAKPQGKIPTITDGQPVSSVEVENSYTVDISSGEMSGGEGMACSESKKKDNNRQLFENLLIITGFDLEPQDKGFILKDKCNMLDNIECCDEKDCINQLRPYIDDTFIIPLQFQTGEKFTEPDEWVNWYTPEMEKKYPKCKSDIDYCKMLLNYLN